MNAKERAKIAAALPGLFAKYGLAPSGKRYGANLEYIGETIHNCSIEAIALDVEGKRQPWLACRLIQPPGAAPIPGVGQFSGKDNCHSFGARSAAQVIRAFDSHLASHCLAR